MRACIGPSRCSLAAPAQGLSGVPERALFSPTKMRASRTRPSVLEAPRRRRRRRAATPVQGGARHERNPEAAGGGELGWPRFARRRQRQSNTFSVWSEGWSASGDPFAPTSASEAAGPPGSRALAEGRSGPGVLEVRRSRTGSPNERQRGGRTPRPRVLGRAATTDRQSNDRHSRRKAATRPL